MQKPPISAAAEMGGFVLVGISAYRRKPKGNQKTASEKLEESKLQKR